MFVNRLMASFLHHLAIFESNSQIESVSLMWLRRYQSPVTHEGVVLEVQRICRKNRIYRETYQIADLTSVAA